MAHQSMCNVLFNSESSFLSQMQATVWWNRATTVSEKCSSRTHYLSVWSKENLETKEANKSSVLFVELILITSYLDSFLKE